VRRHVPLLDVHPNGCFEEENQMALALTLVQTSPYSNPDRMQLKGAFSGTYPAGGEPLLYGQNANGTDQIADPQQIGRIPTNAPNLNPLPVTPYPLNEWLSGYYTEIQRVVNASGTSFFVHVFNPGGTELTGGTAYSSLSLVNGVAPLLAGEWFCEILVPPTQA
jgi:hypothetical protein